MVNDALNKSVAQAAQRFDRRASYVYCGGPFEMGDGVHVDLMPDRLHPNAKGYRIWASCMIPAISMLESLSLNSHETPMRHQ